MKKSLFFKLLCVFSFVFGLFSVSTGLSDYIIDKTTYDENGTLSNQVTSANDNGEKVTVTLKYLYYDRVDSAWENVPGHTDIDMGGGTDSTKYNALKDYFKKNIDSNLTSNKHYEIEKGKHVADGKASYLNYSFILAVTEKIYSKVHGFSRYYYGHYTLQVQKHEFVKNGEANDKILSCNKGISLSSIKNNAKLDAKTGYTFTGIRDVENGAYLSDDVSITTNKELLLCFYKQADVLLDKKISSLTNTINNTTGTIECWEGNSDYTKDISADPSYNQTDNKVYLGTSSLKTTIKAGATIKFDMNNGQEHVSMDVDSNGMSFEPEDGKHERQYTVALANDLIVNGAFTIGGHFGNKVNSAKQGHIMNEYVCLDLNGHDIYVNSGGSLWSYGLIKDSVGTGHIYVNGAGTIYTLVAVMDYRGGSFTKSCKDNKVFPFFYYVLPYVRTKVVFNYKNGWGELNAIFHLTAASNPLTGGYIHTENTLKFIGTGTDCLFKLEPGVNDLSRIILDGYKKEGVNSEMCVDRRVGLIIENAVMRMGAFKFKIKTALVSIDIDTTEYNFPVNPFFDIKLVKSTIYFSQRIQFMAGMSFIADKDSTVIFTTSGEYSAQLSILDKGANYYDNKVGKLITTDNSGETYSYEGNIQNNVDFWKYYSQPKIKIYGKLLFTKGNTSSKKYKLVGPCDFNEDNIGTIDGSNITMYDNTKYPDPFTFLNQNGVSIQTYGFDYQISYDAYHVRGFSRPLVSNGKAYAVNDKDVKIGTYSFNDGIFRMDNGHCYYFNNDNKFTLGDTAGNEMRQCTVTNNIIDDNGTKYIYFASMYGQYDSAASTVNLNRISNNATAVKVSYSRDAERWLRS